MKIAYIARPDMPLGGGGGGGAGNLNVKVIFEQSMEALWVETTESAEIIGWDSMEIFVGDTYRVFPGFDDLRDGQAVLEEEAAVAAAADAASAKAKKARAAANVRRFPEVNIGGRWKERREVFVPISVLPYYQTL